MFSFRSIFIAATAFATIASGIPTAPLTPNVLDVRGIRGGVCSGFHGGAVGASSLAGLGGGLGSLGSLLGGLLNPVSHTVSTKRGSTSPGDIFKTCSDGVELIVVKIDAAVNVEGGVTNIDRSLVIGLLGEIVVLLQIALKDLKVIVVADLTLNGVASSLRELAEIIINLLILVIKVILLVLSLGLADVTLCGVISTIIALLCELLKIVLYLVAGLKVELVYLIKPLIGLIDFSLFTQILVILGIFV